MDNRPIGVFDSGLGGLTAVKELIRLLPGENVIYFGDTGRVPYGNRSEETLRRYTREAVELLSGMQVKEILVACGTASTVLDSLNFQSAPAVTGVIRPACRKAASVTENKKVGLIATARSIASGRYEEYLHEIDPDIRVIGRACPLLVPVIEAGRVEPDDPVTAVLVREYLEEIKKAGVDTLILGCTHYPIIRELINREMGGKVALIDAGAAGAEAVRERLVRNQALSEDKKGRQEFYVSDLPEGFARIGSMFLGKEIGNDTKKIDIQKNLENRGS